MFLARPQSSLLPTCQASFDHCSVPCFYCSNFVLLPSAETREVPCPRLLLGVLIKFYFLLDIFFIYISNVIPFPGFPSENPLSPPVSSAHQHTLLFLVLGIPFHCGTEPSQEQGPLLPLVTDKTILCYKWGLEFHVYSLVGGLVPGSSGGTG